MSKERLDKLWEKYTNDLKSRKKLGCKEIHIATRWSVHDVIGRLEQQYGDDPRCKFIVLPALDENEESNFNYDYGVGFDSKYFLDMKNSLEDVSWRCLFMNQPIEREGILYHESELKTYFDLPGAEYDSNEKLIKFDEPDAVLGVCDTKDTGSDFEFLPVCYQYGDYFYLEDCICDNNKTEILDERCAHILVKHKVKACRFESNNAGGRTADVVQKRVKELGGITHVTKKFTTSNKETKIIVNSPWVKEHVLFKDKSKIKPNTDYSRMMNFLKTFTMNGKNKHDDVVDGMACFAIFVQSLTAGQVKVFTRPF
jgi:predicted phage terminase large subunit-like protein